MPLTRLEVVSAKLRYRSHDFLVLFKFQQQHVVDSYRYRAGWLLPHFVLLALILTYITFMILFDFDVLA